MLVCVCVCVPSIFVEGSREEMRGLENWMIQHPSFLPVFIFFEIPSCVLGEEDIRHTTRPGRVSLFHRHERGWISGCFSTPPTINIDIGFDRLFNMS